MANQTVVTLDVDTERFETLIYRGMDDVIGHFVITIPKNTEKIYGLKRVLVKRIYGHTNVGMKAETPVKDDTYRFDFPFIEKTKEPIDVYVEINKSIIKITFTWG